MAALKRRNRQHVGTRTKSDTNSTRWIMNSQNDSPNAVAKAISATLGALAVLLLSMLLTTPALAGEPCCSITALNPLTGVVTAKVTSSGQIFQFTVANKAQLRALRLGSAVYANFGTHQVSFDGRTIAGSIVSAKPTPIAPTANLRPSVNSIPPIAGATQRPNGPIDGAKVNSAAPTDGIRVNSSAPVDGARVNSASPVDGVTPGVNSAAPVDGARVNSVAPTDGARVNSAPVDGATVNPGAPCCDITGINSSSGLVTARVIATGQMFQFSVNGATVHQLHVGQGVFANFKANRISLDGQHVHGTIIAKGAGPVGLPANAQSPGNTPPSGTVTPPNTKGDPVRPENSG